MTSQSTNLEGYVDEVRYELTELANLAVWICRGRFAQFETTIRNAMLEADLTHARCLIEFILNKDNQKQSIAAYHLNNVWNGPPNAAALETEYTRICDALSHLSKQRARPAPSKPEWNLPWLVGQILDGLEDLGKTLGSKTHELAFKKVVAEVRALHDNEWPPPTTAISASTSSSLGNDPTGFTLGSSTGPPP